MADREAVEVIVSALASGEMTREQAKTDLILIGIHHTDVDQHLNRAARRKRSMAPK